MGITEYLKTKAMMYYHLHECLKCWESAEEYIGATKAELEASAMSNQFVYLDCKDRLASAPQSVREKAMRFEQTLG